MLTRLLRMPQLKSKTSILFNHGWFQTTTLHLLFWKINITLIIHSTLGPKSLTSIYLQNINIKLMLVFYYYHNCRFLFIYQSISFSDGTVFMNVALLTFRLSNFNCQKVLPPRNSLKARTLYYILLNLYSM